MNLSARAVLLASRLAPRAPEDLVRALALLAADLAWWRRGRGVQRLEANLSRVHPCDARTLRRLSREGMRNYFRYFGEAFSLAGRSPEQIAARVRAVGADAVTEHLDSGRSVVLALGHQGNWDLAGAWAARALGPVSTVAERLEPPEVFEAFVALRESLGIQVIPLDRGRDVFRDLVSATRSGGRLVPLLADRDLSERGVEVDLCGHRARVAAGPAALAVSTGAPLMVATLRHERLDAARRAVAGTRWGLVIDFVPVDVPDLPRGETVRALTQAWVDVLGADIAAHPTHWHMLQRVFLADLQERTAAGRAA
ncbi:phosphatidylinositol mannoside acyltransferase [Actinotalea sp.]|uniref:phosphatidylinositol mannoside acyltransferase n=1 Tax=Actinotalea sp. TaxID=1872145 RepID=UPI003564D811